MATSRHPVGPGARSGSRSDQNRVGLPSAGTTEAPSLRSGFEGSPLRTHTVTPSGWLPRMPLNRTTLALTFWRTRSALPSLLSHCDPEA